MTDHERIEALEKKVAALEEEARQNDEYIAERVIKKMVESISLSGRF